MKMPFLLISPKIVPKIQLIKKGGCFEYHAVIADKIEYCYVHRASICPASGMDRRSFFMPKTMGKYKRLEVFYLSKPVYAADKPSDCHYCYYLISLPPKPKSECDGCPYGRDHPCIGWCTKKVMREVGLPRSVRAEEISAEGHSIFQHDPKGKVADAYRVLTKEVLNNAEKRRKHQLEGVR